MILVTGSNGFVGAQLCRTLRARGIALRAAVRGLAQDGQVQVGDLNGSTDWRDALAGCASIIHLAARVHVMDETVSDPLGAYREVNVVGTLNLARQALESGVRRFVFVSSIKVNGEATTVAPFRPCDEPNPCDPYGQSKREAEIALLQFGRAHGLDVVIVRPPLVYGPGVKANFHSLMRLVKLGVPLPLGRIENKRSIVAVENLVDLLILCTSHPKAVGQTFMVSDGQDVSIGELVSMIGIAMDKKVRLLPVPLSLMCGVARVLGKEAVIGRLSGSLQLDISTTRTMLEWTPPLATQAALNVTVAHFMAQQIKGKK